MRGFSVSFWSYFPKRVRLVSIVLEVSRQCDQILIPRFYPERLLTCVKNFCCLGSSPCQKGCPAWGTKWAAAKSLKRGRKIKKIKHSEGYQIRQTFFHIRLFFFCILHERVWYVCCTLITSNLKELTLSNTTPFLPMASMFGVCIRLWEIDCILVWFW